MKLRSKSRWNDRWVLVLIMFLVVVAVTQLTPVQAAPAVPVESNSCGDLIEIFPGVCSHGPDPAPPGVDASKTVLPVKRFSDESGGFATAASSSFVCDGDGVSGPRIQLTYVVAAGQPNRYEEFKATFLKAASDADLIFRTSAQKTGGDRKLRFVHDASCTPTILNITIEPVEEYEFWDSFALRDELVRETAEGPRTNVHFVDNLDYCGLGGLAGDDRPGYNNLNFGGGWAVIGAGCWGGRTVAHEVTHSFGALQGSAPNSTGQGHCNDDYDVMCRPDQGPTSNIRVECSNREADSYLLDCNNDDYFNTDPAPGSYLDMHWNTANSQFLIGADPYRNCVDKLAEPNEGPAQATARPLEFPGDLEPRWGWTFRYGFCAAGDQDWLSVPFDQNRWYEVTISDPLGGAVPKLEVYGPDGVQVPSRYLYGPEIKGVTFWIKQAGQHYLKVWDSSGTAPSTRKGYLVAVRPQEGLDPDPPAYLGAAGFNAFGELGANPATTTFRPHMESLDYSSPFITSLSSGLFHALLADDGKAMAWGWNGLGQLGTGSAGVDSSRPKAVVGESGQGSLTDVAKVSAGYIHSLALKNDGTVWAWGSNAFGQLGDGSFLDSSRPVRVSGLDHVTEISAGTFHNMALKDDGTVWVWGMNVVGTLGIGSTDSTTTPVKVPGLSGVTSISTSFLHSLAAREDGSVWSWGWNAYGMLGDGTTTDRYSPVRAVNLSGITQVAAGYLHSVALKDDGTVWDWGSTVLFQAGEGPDQLVPARVMCLPLHPWCSLDQSNDHNGPSVKKIAAGAFHTVALSKMGDVWSWGWSGLNQIGPEAQWYTYPYPIDNGPHDIAAGAFNTMVLLLHGAF